MSGTVERRLQALGINLPGAPAPVANYIPARIAGDLLFVSGQISRTLDGTLIAGKLGAGMDVTQGQAAARMCGLALLAQAKAALGGDLDRIVACVKLLGFVNGTAEFTQQPAVINGCSDLLVDVLGEAGRHARSAVGVNALPMDASVEIEAIFQVRPA
jgi:enamine deaminase RidA (YjgF/YER057c/UK114 family)